VCQAVHSCTAVVIFDATVNFVQAIPDFSLHVNESVSSFTLLCSSFESHLPCAVFFAGPHSILFLAFVVSPREALRIVI
jgi:hypothetical protein